MNQYVTGAVIRELREKKKLTQAKLAEQLLVSDKTVSKWETGKGYPDVTLLEPIAKTLGVSVAELIAGETVVNENVSSNMLRAEFYVCPICGNIFYSMGSAVIHCHGLQLTPEEAEPCDDRHKPTVEIVEDEYYVTVNHEMTRTHYLTFAAAVSEDRLQLVKLYPEWNAELRLQRRGVKKLILCCNRDGLFYYDVESIIRKRKQRLP